MSRFTSLTSIAEPIIKEQTVHMRAADWGHTKSRTKAQLCRVLWGVLRSQKKQQRIQVPWVVLLTARMA